MVKHDTDNEMGDENNLKVISLNQVVKVSGTVEIQTTKWLSKVKTQEATKPDKLNIRKKKEDYQSKVAKINDVMKSDISKDEKVDKLLKYREKIELLHDWVLTHDNSGENSLIWNTVCDWQQHESFQNIPEQCNRKLPVEIFELLFNHEIRSHIITKTKRYASVAHNDLAFSMREVDLHKFVGVLFLSGYLTLPKQQLYWDRRNDANTPIFYQEIIKNRCFQIKKYLHCADNQKLDLSDKLANVRPIYDLMNTSTKQFSFWHKDFSIDEQMIPYFGMYSEKQTIRSKSTRFGYKNFILTSWPAELYH